MKRLLTIALVVLATACSDHSATQYVGTVMNEAAPEHEGSLRLTLFPHSDTSFAGVIELGAPARGTGSAYAWHVGPELYIVTVAAESGDTIRWFSRLTDGGLGGRFEVTGGDRSGQQGTWRARLVQGPPATARTLRSAPSLPLPSVTALWPVVMLLVTGVGFARWIRIAPRASSAADSAPSLTSPLRLSGVAGWLVLFAIGQAITIVLWFSRFRAMWDGYVSSLGIGAAVTGMQSMLVLETATSLIALPLVLGGLFLLVRRSPYAPRYWFAYLAVSAVYLFVDIVGMSFIYPQLKRLVGAEALAGIGMNGTQQGLLRQLMFTLVWTLYWVRSKRVRATFGAAALDRTVTSPTPAPDVALDAPHSTPPADHRRRWRRVALRTVGIVFATLLALMTIGLWSTRATPYSVPKGRDIRATVAGRWTWARDTARCRSPHTIAFAEAGKVMTITSGSIGASDPVTTYDVLFVSQSTVRGAIRGETRMTDRGKPVVWDLVLTGPDEYRWKRTDWSSSPWSYTGSIHRCTATPAVATDGR